MIGGAAKNVPDRGLQRGCLARSVAMAFAENSRLEAVCFERGKGSVSVATIGEGEFPGLSDRIRGSFEEARWAWGKGGCGLLDGKGECGQCICPLSPHERRVISITHGVEGTVISRVSCPTARLFWRWRVVALPKVVPREVEIPESDREEHEWKWQLAAAACCGLLGLAGFLTSSGEAGAVPWFIGAYVLGAWYAGKEAWERIQRGILDVHFLMLAVAAGSAWIGAWGEGALLLFLFSTSGALEHFAFARTQREIRSLLRDAPKFASVVQEDGELVEVGVPDLKPGMRVLVKPGGQFPVDAVVAQGETACDESSLSGESLPVGKAKGDAVFSGSMNLWGAVEVIVSKVAEESALQRIIALIREAQQRKAPAQTLVDRFSGIYTYAALGGALLMFFVWWLGLGLPAFGADAGRSAFYRTMALLVVASPCALVLSIPSAVLAAIAWGARHGVLFRGGAAVERLAGVKVVALDKTGTLTSGEMRVEAVRCVPEGREKEIAEVACSLARLSSHPLSRALSAYSKSAGVEGRTVEGFESITGQGLRGRIGGAVCAVGRREYVEEVAKVEGGRELDGIVFADSPGDSLARAELWAWSEGIWGRFIFRDEIRPEAKRVMGELVSAGLQTVVLTGDRREAAERLGRELGISDIRYGLKPADKLNAVAELTRGGRRVAMVGDGVNDAPSLAAADIGVAMGARGSDAALEQADVVLMHDRLEGFVSAFRLSQRARAVIRQNVIVSLGTVVVLVGFALAGKVSLGIGVLGHEGSTVVVVMNSLRLLFYRANRTRADGEKLIG
jgi:Zn2+/Cd2+-exporting ATPase